MGLKFMILIVEQFLFLVDVANIFRDNMVKMMAISFCL